MVEKITTSEELKEYKEYLKNNHIFVPDKIYDYIDYLEMKVGQKKTIFTVNAIYQHDMGVEHRLEYQGTDEEKAFKECYSQVKDYIDDSRDDYGYPWDDEEAYNTYTGKKEATFEEFMQRPTGFTGLEIKQMFIDWIKDAIKNKKSIEYNFGYHCDWDDEADGEEGGFSLDIKDI